MAVNQAEMSDLRKLRQRLRDLTREVVNVTIDIESTMAELATEPRQAKVVESEPRPAIVRLNKAAKMLDCSPKHITRMEQAKQIKLTRLGTAVYVPMSEIDRISGGAVEQVEERG